MSDIVVTNAVILLSPVVHRGLWDFFLSVTDFYFRCWVVATLLEKVTIWLGRPESDVVTLLRGTVKDKIPCAAMRWKANRPTREPDEWRLSHKLHAPSVFVGGV